MTLQQENVPVRRDGYAPVNGLNLYYEISGSGKPLVLIHGGGSTIGTTFGRVLPLFEAKHRVLALELQAHGHTGDRETPLSFEQDADDVAGVMKFLGIEKADIFGFSNGGTTALQLAVRHPDMVDRLIVGSAFSKRTGSYPQFWDFIGKATFADMPQELKQAFLEINPSEADLIRMHDRDLARMHAFPDIPDDSLRSVRAETLILSGDRDVLTPEHAIELTRLIPGARLMILPGGHGDYLGEITTLQGGNRSYQHAAALISHFLRNDS